MIQWEYKTVKLAAGGKVDEHHLQEILNALGFEGWELVSSFDTAMSQEASCEVVLIFKRSALLE